MNYANYCDLHPAPHSSRTCEAGNDMTDTDPGTRIENKEVKKGCSAGSGTVYHGLRDREIAGIFIFFRGANMYIC